MKNYILFGAPGAGKGTQSALIAKKYNFCHISTGDLLRKEINEGSEIGLKAKKIIENGNLVDDSIVLEILKCELKRKTDVNGFIFDGYPRTLNQAYDLEKLLGELGWGINKVVCLHIDDDMIFKRIQHRAQIENRKDDTSDEIIRQRIINYHTQTEPIVEYYIKQGKFVEIPGDTTIEQAFEDLCNLIDNS